MTYRRVLYWVNARNHRPHKAEFYVVRAPAQTAYYQEFHSLGGETPARLVVEDAFASRQSLGVGLQQHD